MPFRRAAQRFKILPCTQQRIDAGIIRRIIPVIGMRFENRIEINAGYTQTFEIRQLLLDSPQIAAEVVGIGNFPLLIRSPDRFPLPILPQGTIGGNVLFFHTGAIKTVGENLVHHAACQPVRRLKTFSINGELPLRRFRIQCILPAEAASQPQTPMPGINVKFIEIEPCPRRCIMAFPPLIRFPVHSAPKHI